MLSWIKYNSPTETSSPSSITAAASLRSIFRLYTLVSGTIFLMSECVFFPLFYSRSNLFTWKSVIVQTLNFRKAYQILRRLYLSSTRCDGSLTDEKERGGQNHMRTYSRAYFWGVGWGSNSPPLIMAFLADMGRDSDNDLPS